MAKTNSMANSMAELLRTIVCKMYHTDDCEEAMRLFWSDCMANRQKAIMKATGKSSVKDAIGEFADRLWEEQGGRGSDDDDDDDGLNFGDDGLNFDDYELNFDDYDNGYGTRNPCARTAKGRKKNATADATGGTAEGNAIRPHRTEGGLRKGRRVKRNVPIHRREDGDWKIT